MLLVAAVLTISSAQGQMISSNPACTRCVIDLRKVGSIGGVQDQGIGATGVIARNSRGEILVAPQAVRGQILIYNETGEFVKTVGRRGAGPGEYQRIKAIAITADDSVMIFDPRQSRITILDPFFNFVRSMPAPTLVAPSANSVSWSGQFILFSGRTTDRESSGLPLHLFTQDGKPVRSFGSNGVFRHDYGEPFQIRALPTRTGWWTIPANEYSLSHYNRAGVRTSSLVRQASWFKPRHAYPDPDKPLPTRAVPYDLQGDGAGRLWVAINVPDRRQASSAEFVRTNEGVGPVFRDIERAFDTVIEVIDPNGARLIASRRFDFAIVAGLGNGHYASYREEANGTPFIDIWRARLINNPQRGDQ